MRFIKNLKFDILNRDNRRIYRNLLLISLGQIITFIVALIVLPFLSRTLGPENYGLISFVERSTLIFGIFIDFGLSTISNKKMALNIEDLERKKDIFSQTIYTRFFMGIISGIIFLFLLFSVEKFYLNRLIFFLFFISSFLNYVLQAEYVFKSHEKMIYNSVITTINRILYLILIIIFVGSPRDTQIVAFIFFISYLTSVISSQIIAIIKFNLSYKKLKFKKIKKNMKSGSHIFIMNLSENLYRTSNIFFFGLLVSNFLVGILNISFSIILIIFNLFFIQIIIVLFPRMNKILQEDRKKALKFFRNIIVIIIILGIICFFSLIIFAEPIIMIIAGTQYYKSIRVLQVLAILPLIIGTSSAISFLLLIPLNYNKLISQIKLLTLIFFLTFEFIFVPQLGLDGHCFNLIFSETLVLLISLIIIKKNKIFASLTE